MTSPDSQRADDLPLNLLAQAAPATAASAEDVARLRAGLDARRVHHRRVRFAQLSSAGVAAAAAMVAVVLPAELPAPPPAPVPLAASFDGPSDGPVQAGPGVRLELDGTGELTGDALAPRLAWSAGKVEVSVEPNAGIDLRVQTREGEVRVVGTVFSVERDPLGTTVGVSRGKVEVSCEGQPARYLTAGQTSTCWPTSAGGLLGRARALDTGAAPAEAVLETIDAGLAQGKGTGPIHDELTVLRIQKLQAAGRPDDALPAARAYLAAGSALRRGEVARLGAELLDDDSSCEDATGILAAVRESGTISPPLTALAERCLPTP
jgi:ferric-dicitrate binding protein FerR (iron transport regulator)